MLVLNCSTKLLILENMLRSYFPESLKVYGAVMNINRGNPFQKEVVLDAWPDFKAVITRRQREADTDNLDHYTNAYAVFYKDATAYRQLLEEHGVINWDQVFQIQGLQSELCDVSKAVANSKQLDVKLTSFKAVHFPPVSSLPDTSFLLGPPPRLTSLSVSDAELLDRTWSRGGNEQCLRYLARLLSCFPSACVRDDRGDPVSWAITDQFATMCHGYTLPDHRRRGYSRVVALTLARKLQSRGFPAQGNVLDDNLASINLLQSVGIEPFLPVVRFYCTQRADSRQGPPREPGPSVGCKPRKSGFSRPGSHLRACTAQSPGHGGTAFGVDRKSFRTVGTNHIMNPKLPSSKRGQDFEPLRLLCPSPSGTKDGGPESPGARESPGLCLRPGARGVLSRVLGPSPGTPAPGASGPRVPGPGKSPLSSGPPEGAAGRGGPGRGHLGAEPRGPGRAGAPPPSAGSPADPGPADLLPSRVAASGPLGPFQVAAGARGGLPRGAGGPAHGVGLGPGHHQHGGARPEHSHFPRQPGLRRPWGTGDLTPPGPSCQHPGQDPPRGPGEQRGPLAPRVSDHPEGERPSRACPDPREEAARRPGWARGWRARLALSTTHPKRHHPGPSVPTLLTLALGLVWNWSRVERCERLELATTEERLDKDC